MPYNKTKAKVFKRITMKDIADELQLDRTTVSKALNGQPGLAEKTRKIVLEKAEELGYQKDVFASGLMTRKNQILGLVVTDLSRGLFGPVVKQFQKEARRNNYGVILCNLENTEEGQANDISQLNILRLQRVSGISFVSNATVKVSPQYFSEFIDDDIVFNTVEHGLQLDIADQIQFNHRKAGKELTQHLLSLGHRRIAYLTYSPSLQSYRSTQERMLGYIEAMEAAGYEPLTILENERYSKTFGHEVQMAYEMIRKQWPQANAPTAVIGANDSFALGMLHALKDMGYRIPEDVAVAGFDDLYAEMGVPSITSMRMPADEAGQLAAKLLIKRIKQKEEDYYPFEQTMLDYSIVQRQSTNKKINR